MYPPVDYPVNDDPSKGVLASDNMTYAALLDRYESQEIITDAMIQAACLRMETAQQLPYACKANRQIKHESTGTPATVKLSTAIDLNTITQPAAKALSRWIRVIS